MFVYFFKEFEKTLMFDSNLSKICSNSLLMIFNHYQWQLHIMIYMLAYNIFLEEFLILFYSCD